MRTVQCYSRLLGGGVCSEGVCLPGGVCPGGVWQTTPMDRILDTRLWKHYLSTTSFVDGNYYKVVLVIFFSKNSTNSIAQIL